MGRKSYNKKGTSSILQTRLPLSEEEIEDMKHIYNINGVPILALNENIAKDIYNRNNKVNDIEEVKETGIKKVLELILKKIM